MEIKKFKQTSIFNILRMIEHKIHSLIYPQANQLSDISILIVGVGGIGCQLLKVLSKTPIGTIHIIDMDTIELTNLNRQFLFKQEHKGESKAQTAKETMQKINPYLNIVAHHKNIKQLPIGFFKQFNFIVLALDNIDARNYVNKIGVRLNIPLIDAGTSGYLGNVHIIIPKETKCYSCQPKETSKKSFPVCTIRMRPEKPIHCIHWAKLLFQVFFSGQQVQNDMKDLEDLGKQNKQVQILEQLFNKQIQNIKDAKVQSDQPLSKQYISKLNPLNTDLLSVNYSENIESFDKFEQKLTLQENIGLAKLTYGILFKQKLSDGSVVFEKDDDNIIHFISCMANIRMSCFGIENQSFNEVKNIAGNIVPAIASTNSIVSGLQVFSMMFKWIDQSESLRSFYIQNQAVKVMPVGKELPEPNCQVCSESNSPVIIEGNFQKIQLRDIVNFVKQKLFDVEQFSLNKGSKQIYNSEEPNEILLKKKISEIDQSKYEMQLLLTDEGLCEKICNLWLINNSELEKIQFSNEKRLNIKPPKVNENGHNNQEPEKNQSDDIVMMGDGEQDDDIEIVEVKKNIEEVEDEVKKKIKEL